MSVLVATSITDTELDGLARLAVQTCDPSGDKAMSNGFEPTPTVAVTVRVFVSITDTVSLSSFAT